MLRSVEPHLRRIQCLANSTFRTGRPVWSAYRAPAVPTTALNRDAKADVLIVGMGISGAMMAEALTADGHSVISIDRRGPLKGSTPATTALVQFEIDQPLSTLSKMIGKGPAEQAWRRSRLAVSNLAARIAELGVNCGPSRTQSLYLAGTVLGPAELRDEADARRQAGIAATYLTPAPLAEAFGIDRDGAILSHGNIALDPRKLTAGLLLEALERKARFYAPVEATTIEDSADEVVVATRDGQTITARHVVLATGYELVDVVPAAAHQIISTWAMATRSQSRKSPSRRSSGRRRTRTSICARQPTAGSSAAARTRILSTTPRRDRLIADKSARISEKLGRLFPHLDVRPEFAWTGSFGTTTTGLPYIGALPRHPRIHAVMGYGGNGITFSQIASEIVSASINGLGDTDARLFAFNR